MSEVLEKYLPSHAVAPIFDLIEENNIHLKIVNERVTRHGDYRRTQEGVHQITINANLNKFRFLITMVHEIAPVILRSNHVSLHDNSSRYKSKFLIVGFSFT